MKTKLIILENKSLIVSDEELLNEKDFYLGYPDYNHIFQWNMGNGIHKGKSTYAKKIIAGLENLPTINYSALSDEDCEKIGYINVENYSKLEFPPDFNVQGDELDYYERMAFIKGFKKAQSLNDKKFSLEDMNKILSYLTSPNLTDEYRVVFARKHIQSLQQPKVFDVEVEMERTRYPKDDDGWEDIYKPKITNNSIKITKVL